VGGVQASHAINANGNTSYNISYNGAWTHSVSGQTSPNGGFGLLNYIIPSGSGSGAAQNISLGIYVNTTTNTYGTFEIDFGVRNSAGSGNVIWRLDAEWTAQNNSNAYFGSDNQQAEVTPPKGKGLYVATRTSNTGKLFHNGSLEDTSSPTVNGSSQYSISLGGQYNGTVNQFSSSKRQAFAFLGEYLSDSEVATISTLINNFETTLGRN
jgi:phosphatidate phosphatase APP1